MLVKTLIGLFSFFFMVNVSIAKSLPEELQDFFVALHQQSDKVTVSVLTPEQKWPICQTQEIQRHAGSRNWGRLSIPIQCDNQRRFIQVDVSVTGKYLVAKKDINRDDAIETASVSMITGELEKQPYDVLRDPTLIKNAIAMRQISAGKPITSTMIRRPWAILAGQTVTVFAQGDHFQIRYEGKAINNAVANETIRVRVKSGQIVTGEALENGSVRIPL
ncbi:flagellar basal body P-ring formation chaperone FlgA [Proteus faecis]|uniref:Flagella basal body P-ring formation protein FlgA n=1 Tax=Proteus faecis TaxID=2050967 RepID=A0AAW7CK75_9GAMM|nr:flagellar basal body P-ring formation chaperone FlgA [Proteus faecis]MBG3012293.1 flagellar basal body P-ring formation protein FlgA [Proteus mirabilis]MDL5166730.1 flagellar basal body P-ring formation chaperone FlgA [Proteus faecis]MDL5274635.1 flagellar basal body P-ring formation chaperone FlgA [Proteus faecis]MDL5278284.1 flagellar basal body P-ring formation chaperone FlgA [Proteus faecis]MDL5307286.1 flagellar basal body P-ring formation chaperone FlgA [Proteus faecis]